MLARGHAQIKVILVVVMLLVGCAVAVSGRSPVRASTLSPSDDVAGFLEQARNRQMPEARPGQVVHVVYRQYERHDSSAIGGPQHLDPTVIAPDVTLTDIWAVADDTGRASRVVTYVRDEAGRLIEVNVINEKAQLTAHSPRHGTTVTASFTERSTMPDIGGRAASLTNLPPSRYAQPLREQVANNQATVALEYLSAADPTWLRMVQTGELRVPYAGDLQIRDQGRRLVFDRDSRALLREEDFVVTGQDKEYVLRSKAWEQIEVFDAGRVPKEVLDPAVPVSTAEWKPVPLTQLPPQQATTQLPFALFIASGAPGDNSSLTVRYTSGPQQAIADVPLRFRGLDFAVQRGEAASLSYSSSARHVDLIQGSSTTFATSLRESPAFWSNARRITVGIEGTIWSGWLLTSSPGNTVESASGATRQVPGVTWLLLPDVQGTGLLLMSQGYSEEDLLAFATKLHRVR